MILNPKCDITMSQSIVILVFMAVHVSFEFSHCLAAHEKFFAEYQSYSLLIFQTGLTSHLVIFFVKLLRSFLQEFSRISSSF